MEVLVEQLREQVSVLNTFLHEERLRHKREEQDGRKRHEQALEKLGQKHLLDMEKLEKKHENYMKLMKSQHKSILQILEKTLQEKLKRMKNECTLMQAALRNYKDVVRADMGKMWAAKVDTQNAEIEEKIAKAVLAVRLEMGKQFEMEKEDLKAKYEADIKVAVQEALDRLVKPRGSGIESQMACDNRRESIARVVSVERRSSCQTSENVASAETSDVVSEGDESNSTGIGVVSSFVRRTESGEKRSRNEDDAKERRVRVAMEDEISSTTESVNQTDTNDESAVQSLVLVSVSDDENQK